MYGSTAQGKDGVSQEAEPKNAGGTTVAGSARRIWQARLGWVGRKGTTSGPGHRKMVNIAEEEGGENQSERMVPKPKLDVERKTNSRVLTGA